MGDPQTVHASQEQQAPTGAAYEQLLQRLLADINNRLPAGLAPAQLGTAAEPCDPTLGRKRKTNHDSSANHQVLQHDSLQIQRFLELRDKNKRGEHMDDFCTHADDTNTIFEVGESDTQAYDPEYSEEYMSAVHASVFGGSGENADEETREHLAAGIGDLDSLVDVHTLTNRTMRFIWLVLAFEQETFVSVIRAKDWKHLYVNGLVYPWLHKGAKPSDQPKNNHAVLGKLFNSGCHLYCPGANVKSHRIAITWYCHLCDDQHTQRVRDTWVMKMGVSEMKRREWTALI